MNPAQYSQPEQLFGASMHAGGWPKLGWAKQEATDEGQGWYEGQAQSQQED